LLTEGLVERGVEVTLFATADSETSANLQAVCPRGYEEDRSLDPKVWEGLHIAAAFERAQEFDLIHNNFDFLPLTYSALVETPIVTTIHGFSSPRILPVYRRYNEHGHYVSISNADRDPSLNYVATVYHGIDIEHFTFRPAGGDGLVFLQSRDEDIWLGGVAATEDRSGVGVDHADAVLVVTLVAEIRPVLI